MFRVLVFCLLMAGALFAKDYDCVVVGTSPVSMIEALYQSAAGKSVLVLERDVVCGGSWKSIDVCGVAHVDMGCHHIGGSRALGEFLGKMGCKVVSMSEPLSPYNQASAPLGLYFPEGCYELVSALEARVRRFGIDLRLGCGLENVTFQDGWTVLNVGCGEMHRAKKIFYTAASRFAIEGKEPVGRFSKYYHLYLLIADGGSVRCSYRGGFARVSRIMNLTPFAGLSGSGLQLFVLQVSGDEDLKKGADFLQSLKSFGLVDGGARIVQQESYIYEQYYGGTIMGSLTAEQKTFFELLDTSHLGSSLGRYLDRWNTLLK